MLRMSKNERIADIAKRCNLSVDMVSSVLKAERESMMESLKKGEKVTLAGRVVVNPVIRHKLGYDNDGQLVTLDYVSATAKPINSVIDELSGMDYFDIGDADVEDSKNLADILKENKIQLLNIPALD